MNESSKMDMSKTESKRILRSLELKAYRNVVDALRAQGSLNKNKQEVLKNLAMALKVGQERCRSEIRRAVNDDLLNSIAQSTNGKSTENNWRAESVKKVPSTPMFAAQTVFTALADNISDLVSSENERLSESRKSLHDLLVSREQITESNASRYHNSKLLGSLLANKTFRYDSIMLELEKIVSYNCSNRKSSTHLTDANPVIAESKKTVQWNDEISTSIASVSETQNNEDRHRNRNGPLSRNANRHVRKPGAKVTRVNKSKRNNENEFCNSRSKTDSKNIEVSDPIKDFVNQLVSKGKTNSEARSTTSLNMYVNNNLKPSIRTKQNVQTDITDKRSKRKPKMRNPKQLSAMARNRPLNSIQRMKAKVGASSPNKNARRRKGDVTKSMEDDFMDVHSTINAQKLLKDTHKKKEAVTKSDKRINSTAVNNKKNVNASDQASTSDNFRIEIGSTSLEDDMKPHTFNLIPASRRLKLLQKRAQLSNDESAVPVKKLCSSRESSSTVLNVDNRFRAASVESSSEENSNSSARVSESTKEVDSLMKSIFSRGSRCQNSSILPQINSKKERLSLLGNIKVRNLNELSKDPPKVTETQGAFSVSDKSTVFGVGETSSDSVSESESSVNKNQGFRGFASTNGFSENVPSTSDSTSDSSESSSDSDEDSSDGSEEGAVNGTDSKIEIVEDPVMQPFQTDEQLIDIESADVIIEDLEEHLSADEDETESASEKEDSDTVSRTQLEIDNTETSEKTVCSKTTCTNTSSSELETNCSSEASLESSNSIYIIKEARPVSELWNSLKMFPSSKVERPNSSSTVATVKTETAPSTCESEEHLPSVTASMPSIVINDSREAQILGKKSFSGTPKNLASANANFIHKIALNRQNKVSKLLLLTKNDSLPRLKDDSSDDKKIKITEKFLHLSDSAVLPSASSVISPILRPVTLKSIDVTSNDGTKLKLDSSVSVSSTDDRSEDVTNTLNHNEIKARELAQLVHKLRWTKKESVTPEQKESAVDKNIKIANKSVCLIKSTGAGKIVVLTKPPRQITSKPSCITEDGKIKFVSDSVFCKVKNLSLPQCSASSYEEEEVSVIDAAGETDNVLRVEHPVVISKEYINVEPDFSGNSEKVEVSTDSMEKIRRLQGTFQKAKLPPSVPTTSTASESRKLQFGLPVQKMIQLHDASEEDESGVEPSSVAEATEVNEQTKKGTWIEISSCTPNSDFEITDTVSISSLDDELNENGS